MKKDAFVGYVPPEYFFALELDVAKWKDSKKKDAKAAWGESYLLPQFCKLFQEEPFAEVSMAWSPEGLYFFVDVAHENPTVSFPEVQKGDSIELFIDTKNLKTARTTHRFCHHFYFLPERIEGTMAGESTRFRTEDSHPLCSADDLEVKVIRKKKGYTSEIFIPQKCLIGYQPEIGGQLGFTYRINRANDTPQHFAISSTNCEIENNPYLWALIKLVEKT